MGIRPQLCAGSCDPHDTQTRKAKALFFFVADNFRCEENSA